MKKILFSLASIFIASVFVNAAPFSYYSQDKYYFQLSGSMDAIQNTDISGVGLTNNKLNNDNGFGVSAALGTYIDPVRFEAEYSYRSYDTSIATGSGDVDYNNFMMNVLYESSLGENMFFYAGAGLGLSYINLTLPLGNDDDLVFAYQALLGVGYKITNNMSLTLGYRFFRTLDADFTMNGQGLNMDPASINAFEMGVKMDF